MAAGCEIFIKPEEIQIFLEKSEFPEGTADSPLDFIRHRPLAGRLRGAQSF